MSLTAQKLREKQQSEPDGAGFYLFLVDENGVPFKPVFYPYGDAVALVEFFQVKGRVAVDADEAVAFLPVSHPVREAGDACVECGLDVPGPGAGGEEHHVLVSGMEPEEP